MHKLVEKEVTEITHIRVIERSTSVYNEPAVLTKKPDGFNRFFIGLGNLNNVLITDGEPIWTSDVTFMLQDVRNFFLKWTFQKDIERYQC